MTNFTLTLNLLATNLTDTLKSSFVNQTTPIPCLDELLDQLGFKMWESVLNTFILPPINIIGILLCSFSLLIFLRPSFEEPIFFYYKLLCQVNIINLLLNIPACLFFSPQYYPMIDTFAASVYLIFDVSVSLFLFHFEDVLQMAIL